MLICSSNKHTFISFLNIVLASFNKNGGFFLTWLVNTDLAINNVVYSFYQTRLWRFTHPLSLNIKIWFSLCSGLCNYRHINFKLGPSDTETAWNISFNEYTVNCWFKKFDCGESSFKDTESRERTSAFANSRRLSNHTTTREIAEGLNIPYSKVVFHLDQLDKWVPHELHDSQWFLKSSVLLLRNRNDPFLDRVVTWDEKWKLYDNG